MDEARSTKAPRARSSLEVDPRNEWKIFHSIDNGAAYDFKLGPAAHTIDLLGALETFQFGRELGPFRREARQGVQLGFLLQEPGAVHPLPALPPLLTFTCTRQNLRSLIKHCILQIIPFTTDL